MTRTLPRRKTDGSIENIFEYSGRLFSCEVRRQLKFYTMVYIMTVDRLVRLFAGLMILISVALTIYVHPYWVGLTIFVGVNLAQSALTNLCPLASILKRMGVPESVSSCG